MRDFGHTNCGRMDGATTVNRLDRLATTRRQKTQAEGHTYASKIKTRLFVAKSRGGTTLEVTGCSVVAVRSLSSVVRRARLPLQLAQLAICGRACRIATGTRRSYQ